MPFVEGGLVEEIPQAAPTGGFVEGGLAEDPTPEDAYNIVRGFMSAQHDVAPSKQEFLQYEKVSKEKPYPWRELPGAVFQTGKELVGLPQKAVETVAEAVYQPSFADTQAMIGATQAEVALRSKERAKDIGLGLIDTILNQYDKATGASAEESDQKRYDRFLARSDIKRNLIRAQTGQQPSVDVQTMQQLGIPTESISQPGVQVGEFMAAPENIAFAGGGKLAGMALQQAGRALPAVGSAMRATGERIYNVAGFPERFAGAATTALTGSEAAGQRAAQAVSAGSAAITGAEIAGVEGLSASVPVLPTLAKGISAGKAAGATLETVGEAAQVAGGPSLSAAQQYLLNAGERIAAAPGASAATKALGTFIAKSGVEAPAVAAMKILIPAAGGGLAGGLFAGMTGEEKDAIVHSIGGGIAFGALDSAFNLSKAAASGALNGQRVRSAAVADLNARPETAQFTFIDNLGNTTDSTLNDKASRSALYNKLDDAQLTKTLSEVANAEAAGTDVIFHDSSAQLPKGIDAISYKGVYIPPESIKAGRPTILINVDKVSPETLPHELVHARVTPDFIRQVSSNVLEGKIDEVQFKDFAEKYANQLESAGSKQLADKMKDELANAFNTKNTRAQRIVSLENIVSEFTSYYAQEWLSGRDVKKLLPGRIPAWYESAFNKAKEVVSDKFSRRALQAGFDPISRSFYDASGKRLRIPWMEDSINKLITKEQGFEGIDRKIDTRLLSRARREALIQSKGWTDLYQLAPDGSIQRPLSPKEVSKKTAEIAKRTTDVLEAMPKDKRASKTALDDKGEPVVQGRLSPEEAKAISDSGIFSPSTSRFLIEMAKGMIEGNLFDTKYWKVYGRSGKAGVFGESDKTILPYAISINSKGGVNIKVVDWSKVQGRMQSALKKSQYKNLFKNYDDAYRTMRDVYLKNLADPLSQIESADALGGGVEGNRKRNFFNEVMGAVPKVADVMINAPTAGYEASRKGGSVYQDLRLERIQDLVENGDKIPWSGDMGETSSYRRTQLNWQPAEQIGDTTAKSDSIGGYRILSSGDKFRLYAPSGEKVGIFDTEGQAKLKAEKAYATSQRIQSEVGQQEYQPRNEVGQTAEAGGGYRNVGSTQGGAEGGQTQRPVRQEGDVRYMPEEEFTPEQRKAVSAAKKRSVEVSRKYPEALRLEIQTDRNGRPKLEPVLDDEGNPMLDAKGKPMMEVSYSKESYDLLGSPKISKNRDRAVLQTADLLESDARKAINVPDIQKGIGWYSRMREFLQQQFGANIEIFGQLLGATSARTPVDTNFRQALEALRMLSTGKYDDLLADFGKYSAQTYADANSGELFRQWKEKNPGKRDSQFKVNDEIRKRINAYEAVPLRENGKKFNANSKKVLHVLYNVWLDQTVGPKTPNFAGNLTGRTLKATIDVWAARNMRRLLYEGANKKWRLLPEQESGVTDPDFFFAQDVYDVVGKRLGMNADDLQALMWFMEKDVWEKNGWTSTVGAEKSSFDKEAGKLALDRYQAGVTTFTNPEQYKPDIQEQERMALRKSIAQIPGMTSSRVTLSDGLYGDYIEPSLDVEFSVQRNKDGSSQNISNQVSEILRIASEQGRKQNDVFVSKVVDANHPNARPMVEVGFKKAASPEDIQAVVQAFRSNGVDGFTIAKDARGNVIGIRSQYIPEISARFDTLDHIDQSQFIGFADQWISNVKKSLSAIEQIENVSYKNPGWVSTTVYGIEEYSTAKPKDNGRTSLGEELERRKSILKSGQISSGSAAFEGMEPGASGLPTTVANVSGQSSGGAIASEVGQARYMPTDIRERSININDSDADYTGMIVRGEKTIETRDNPTSLKPYIGKRVGLVSTGTGGKSMLVGSAVIGEPKQYDTENAFRKDYSKHRVEPGSKFDIRKGSKKWGYPLTDVRQMQPTEIPPGGIVSRIMPEGFTFMPDASMPGVYSMGSYRVMPSKTGNRYRVYGPIGQLVGIASNLDDAQRMIQRKLK